MAASITDIKGSGLNVISKVFRVRAVRLTCDSSYPTGGYPINLDDEVDWPLDDVGCDPYGGYSAEYDSVTKKILIVTGSTEVVAGTNLTSAVITLYLKNYIGNDNRRELAPTSLIQSNPGSVSGIGGSGTIDTVAKFTAATTIGDSVICESGSNIGIGVAPTYKLDVKNDVKNTYAFRIQSSDNQWLFGIKEESGTDGALYVFKADGTGGVGLHTAGNSYINSGFGFGINTTSPDEAFHVVGSVKIVDGSESNGYVLTSDANGVGSWQAPTLGTITGSGTTDRIAKFTGASAIGDSVIYESSGNIGIGQAPTANTRLDIKNPVANRYALRIESSDGAYLFGVKEEALTDGVLYVFRADGTGGIGLHAAGNSYIHPSTTDGLGVGTYNPDAKLEVLKASGAQLRLTQTDGTHFADFTVDSNHDLTITPSSTGQIILQPTTDSVDFFQVLNADGSTPVFNVDSINAKVGIGTDAPTEKLHIAGAGTIRFIVENTADAVTLRFVAASDGAHFGSVTNDPLIFNVNNTEVARLTGTGFRLGNYGVDSDPAALLDLRDIQPDILFDNTTNTWRQVFVASDSTMRFQYNLANKFTLTSAGNLGINTTSPNRKLNVVDAAHPQMRLTHTSGTHFVEFQVNGDHNLTITPSSTGQVILQPTTDSTDFFQVLDADGGTPVLNVDTTNERVGIGVGTPAHVLDVKSSGANTNVMRIQNSAGGYLLTVKDEPANDGALYVWKSGGTAGIGLHTAGYSYIDSGDNFGISTTTPDRKLEVLDASNPQLRLTHTDGTHYVDFKVDTNHDLTIKPSSTGQVIFQPTTDSVDFFQVLDADGGTPVLNVDSTNERVGILTNAPAYLLDLKSNVAGDYVFKITGSTDNDFVVGIKEEATHAGSMYIFRDGSAAGIGLSATSHSYFMPDAGYGVGIGVLTPDRRLEVLDGGGNAQLRLTHTDGTHFADFQVDGSHDLTIKPSSTGQIILQPTTDSVDFLQVLDADGGTPIFNIDTVDELVGIGTASPQFPLEIRNSTIEAQLMLSYDDTHFCLFSALSSHDLYIWPTSTGGIRLWPDDNTTDFFQVLDHSETPIFNVDSTNQRVGILTSAPDTAFHVVGSIKMVDGNESNGYVLTSDAAGVGSWQAAAGGISGSGTTDRIAKFTGASAIGDSVIYESGSHIGIGTNPTALTLFDLKNDVAGRYVFKITASGDTDYVVGIKEESDHAGSMYIFRDGSAAGIGLSATSYSYFMPDAGYGVGIGVLTPDRRLEVLDGGGNAQLRLTFADNSKYAEFKVDTNHDLTIKPSSTGQVILQPTTDSADFFQVRDADGGTSVFNVDTIDEHVGIGIDAPLYPLDIKNTTANDYALRIQSSLGGGQFLFGIKEEAAPGHNGVLYVFKGDGSGGVGLHTAGVSYINSGQGLAVGGTVADSMLHIGDSTNKMVVNPTGGGITYSGTARPTRYVELPIRTGCLFADGGDNNCTVGYTYYDAVPARLYAYVTGNADAQDYHIMFEFQIPDDFAAWAAANSFSVDIYSTDYANSGWTITLYDGAGSADAGINGVSATNTGDSTWETFNDQPTASYSAGDWVMLICEAAVDNTDTVGIARIYFSYLAKN